MENLPHYCTHAIESLQETAKRLRNISPETSIKIERVVAMLRKAIKFTLPDNGDLLDKVSQTQLDLLRLPYPCIALEYTYDPPNIGEPKGEVYAINGIEHIDTKKRIALCWELSENNADFPEFNSLLDEHPEGGAFVFPIWHNRIDQFEGMNWSHSLGCAFVPYGAQMQRLDIETTDPITRRALDHLKALNPKHRGQKEAFQIGIKVMFKDMYARMKSNGLTTEQCLGSISTDVAQEISALVQTCSVLNCSNVTSEEIPAPAKLNAARSKKNREPFYPYKFLVVSGEKKARSPDRGSTHASPIWHLRRGHPRRLEKRTLWIRDMVINAGKQQFMTKEYVIRTSP